MKAENKSKIPFINLSNLKDKNYLLLVISQLVISCVIGTVFSTVLDFISITLKQGGNNLFYNYASIASAVGLLPSAFSIIIGIIIVKYTFKSLSKYIFITGTAISFLVWLIHSSNYYLISFYVFLMMILVAALSLSINKLIYKVLKGRYEDFLSDLMILSGMLAAGCYKLAGFFYGQFGYSYIFVVTIVGFFVLFVVGLLTANVVNNTDDKNSKSKNKVTQPNDGFLVNVKLLIKHNKLITFLVLINGLVLFVSPFGLLITTLTFHAKFGTAVYSSAFSFSTISGLVAALIFKINVIKVIDKSKTFVISIFSLGLLFACFTLVKSVNNFYVGMIIYGMVNVMMQLSVSSILYNYISNQKVLTNIAPFIQGVIISLMTAVGLVSAGVVNILLRHSYDYNTLLLMCGFIIIIFGIFTLRFKVLSSQHNRKSSARVSSVKKNVNQSELNENEGAEGPLLLDGQVRGS